MSKMTDLGYRLKIRDMEWDIEKLIMSSPRHLVEYRRGPIIHGYGRTADSRYIVSRYSLNGYCVHREIMPAGGLSFPVEMVMGQTLEQANISADMRFDTTSMERDLQAAVDDRRLAS